MQIFIGTLVMLALLNFGGGKPNINTLPTGVARWVDSGQYVEIDGLNVHYLVQGQGDPIVLIHGLGGWIYSWRGNIEALALSHQVYALDLPGFGLSEKPADWDYSLAHQAQFVNDFMQHFGIERATVIGNSMGGGIALELAARHPERVTRLVLIDSVAYVEVWVPYLAEQLSYTPVGAAFARFFMPHFSALKKIIQGLYADPAQVTDAVTWGYYYPLTTPGVLQASLAMTRTLRFTVEHSRLQQIQQPALLIWGAHDHLVPLSQGERLAHDLPNATLAVLADTGHIANEEQPQEVNGLILDFLAKLRLQTAIPNSGN
jgi:2-hydroxy-6-oxonona-2,4-dienedioate hydrolase